MPSYIIPARVGPGTNPIEEAAKNFMQSPGYARQFMSNADAALAAPPPAAPAPYGALPAPGGGGGGGGGGYDASGMSPAALAAYEGLTALYPDLIVNSAYRDAGHNAAVGGARGSQHIHGNAYDFSTAGMPRDEVGRLINSAYDAGFSGVGVYDNSVHFDVGPQRAWGPDYHRGSLPAWANPYIRG